MSWMAWRVGETDEGLELEREKSERESKGHSERKNRDRQERDGTG